VQKLREATSICIYRCFLTPAPCVTINLYILRSVLNGFPWSQVRVVARKHPDILCWNSLVKYTHNHKIWGKYKLLSQGVGVHCTCSSSFVQEDTGLNWLQGETITISNSAALRYHKDSPQKLMVFKVSGAITRLKHYTNEHRQVKTEHFCSPWLTEDMNHVIRITAKVWTKVNVP
jgi:hypothetical protein